MGAARPRLVVIGEPPASVSMQEAHLACDFPAVTDKHPCEKCRCCACLRICTKCRDNCRPMESNLIPVLFCPDFIDLRDVRPIRYLYRPGCDCEYRLRLPGTR